MGGAGVGFVRKIYRGRYSRNLVIFVLVRSLHEDMNDRFNAESRMSENILIQNEVKQGDILAPIQFAIYVTMVF